MSSACMCHLNEFCFYCEVYSPLLLENKLNFDRANKAEKEVSRLIAWHNRETQINIAEKNETEKERDELYNYLNWTLSALTRYTAGDPVKNLDEIISGAMNSLSRIRSKVNER